MEQTQSPQEYWKKCNSCKKPIAFRTKYWVCNVSTCNRKRTGLSFCSVDCWDAHLPIMNHRESWAEERNSPSREEWMRELEAEKKEQSIATAKQFLTTPSNDERKDEDMSDEGKTEVLVVASKVKNYIREKSGGMNTSGAVMDALTQKIRQLCEEAINRAKQDGRKTVMDRDFF